MRHPSIPGPGGDSYKVPVSSHGPTRHASYADEDAHVEDLADGDEEEEGDAAGALGGVYGGGGCGGVGEDHGA